MLAQFSGLLHDLYRGCREQPACGFQDWAFERIKTVLPFDSAIWLTGTVLDGQHSFHSSHCHAISPDVLAGWARCKNHSHAVKVFLSPGVTFNTVAATAFDPEMLAHSRRYRIEHLLATTVIDPVSSLNEMISLYRADPSMPFSEEERLLQQNLVSHLAETWRINRMTHLNQLNQTICATNTRSAAVDAKGVLHLIEPGLTSLLHGEWPQWRGPRLPDELAAHIENRDERYVGKTLVIQFSGLNDLVLLRGRRRFPVDALSRREHDVAEYFSAGKTYKEVAKSLALSPATVRNHLNTIYFKLGIDNKTELANIMKEYA